MPSEDCIYNVLIATKLCEQLKHKMINILNWECWKSSSFSY